MNDRQNRPTSANWFLAPIGRRPAWDRPGPPPPYNVPRALLGLVPGTPAYPSPLLDAACAACAGPRGEAGAYGQADVQKASDIFARLLCLANGEIPSTFGLDIENDMALAAASSPYCWLDPRSMADRLRGAENATGAALADLLWAIALEACPAVAARDPLAYFWDGVSSPPPRLVTLVNVLGVAFGLPVLAPPISFAAFQTRALEVARAGLRAGARATTLSEVIDELGGGSPLRIARAFLERIGQDVSMLPDPGVPQFCEARAVARDDLQLAMWNLPAPAPGPLVTVATTPTPTPTSTPWGWILGGAGLLAAVGTAIYLGTRGGKKKRRRNPSVVVVRDRAPRRRRNYGPAGFDGTLLQMDAPLQGPMFTANPSAAKTIRAAIDESVQQNRIVRLPSTPSLTKALERRAAGDVVNRGEREFWGGPDRRPWRIHLTTT